MVWPTAGMLCFLLFLASSVSAETGRFAVMSAASDIHWRTYSDSSLPLGHNHTISASRVSGTARLANAPQTTADTRTNMLGGSLLNAARYAKFRLSSTAVVTVGKRQQNLVLHSTLELAGRRIHQVLPARLQFHDSELQAQGCSTLSHRQLDLKPFSAAMDALRVAENIDVAYDIRAKRSNYAPCTPIDTVL